MSHRIFVNSLNTTYRSITQNSKGFEYGLGITSTLTESEQSEIRINELFYTAEDLRNKQRKLQIIFDSFTDPRFFGDGAVKIDKVEKYLTDLRLEAEQAQRENNAAVNAAGALGTTAAVAAAGGAIAAGTFTGLATAGLLTAFGGTVTAGAIGGAFVAGASAILLPAAAVLSPVIAITNLIKSTRQAGREDNASPWKMTRADFPNITAQAIQNSPTRRSIERLRGVRHGTARVARRSRLGRFEQQRHPGLGRARHCHGADFHPLGRPQRCLRRRRRQRDRGGHRRQWHLSGDRPADRHGGGLPRRRRYNGQCLHQQ